MTFFMSCCLEEKLLQTVLLKFLQAFTFKPMLKWVTIVRYNSAKVFTLKSKCYP